MSTNVIFSADGTLTSADIDFEYMTSNLVRQLVQISNILLRTASWLKLLAEEIILRFY